MKLINISKKIFYSIIFLIFFLFNALADLPTAKIGVIDLNYILSESKAAKDGAEQIEKIAIQIEEEIKVTDQSMIDEQNELAESQMIMAPAVFEEKEKNTKKSSKL